MKLFIAFLILSSLSAFGAEKEKKELPEKKQQEEAQVNDDGPTNDFSPYPYAIDDKLDEHEGMGEKEWKKRDKHPDR